MDQGVGIFYWLHRGAAEDKKSPGVLPGLLWFA